MRNGVPASRRSFVRLLGLGAFVPPMSLGAEEIWFSRDSGNVLSRAVIVPREKFARAAVAGLALRFLEGPAAGKAMAQLVVGTDEDTLASSLFHGAIVHQRNDDRSTREGIRSGKLPRIPTARLLAIQGRGVLAFRDERGFAQQLMSTASNPLRFGSTGSGMQLLHITLTEPGPALRKDDFTLTVFARFLGHPSTAEVSEFTRRLFTLAEVGQLSVYVRPDAYFPEYFDFPAIFPFQPNLALPEFGVVGPRVWCSVGRNYNLRCAASGVGP